MPAFVRPQHGNRRFKPNVRDKENVKFKIPKRGWNMSEFDKKDDKFEVPEDGMDSGFAGWGGAGAS